MDEKPRPRQPIVPIVCPVSHAARAPTGQLDDPAEWKKVRRAWMLGREEFRKELLERMSALAGPSHYGTELRESKEEKASRTVAQEIQKEKFRKIDLDQLSKSVSRKSGLPAVWAVWDGR